jgi:hypothetical protein
MTTPVMLEVFTALRSYLRERGFVRLVYRVMRHLAKPDSAYGDSPAKQMEKKQIQYFPGARGLSMKWEKKGLVYGPDGSFPWARHSALTPTPVLLDDDTLRVYAGFRDDAGRSRIGYVDVNPEQPTQVLRVSPEPVLDRGGRGAFDENGVILGDIVPAGDALRMYYVGFQQPPQAKFLAYTGLAESWDGGETFHRVDEKPVLGSAAEGTTIRALHTIRYESGVWKAWYVIGSGWEQIDGVPYPRYSVAYTESPDGLSFPAEGQRCIDPRGDEYRIGRPRVVKYGEGYRMLYTIGTRRKTYLPGYATSHDGVRWQRKDQEIGIAPSVDGWDSQHLSYLAPIVVRGRTVAFYNGNSMGRSGFGYAVLQSW